MSITKGSKIKKIDKNCQIRTHKWKQLILFWIRKEIKLQIFNSKGNQSCLKWQKSLQSLLALCRLRSKTCQVSSLRKTSLRRNINTQKIQQRNIAPLAGPHWEIAHQGITPIKVPKMGLQVVQPVLNLQVIDNRQVLNIWWRKRVKKRKRKS